MKSARQRLAIRLPQQAEFDAQPLKINGVPVTPEQESATTIFAPLVDQDADQLFVLELRYNVEGKPDRIELPSFPDDPAVQKVYLEAYLPWKTEIVKSAGPWTYELDRRPMFWEDSQNDGDRRARNLTEWVCQGVGGAKSSVESFPVGRSRRYVYSTLRPAPPPNGDLRLSAVTRVVFQAAFIGLLGLIGLPLLAGSLRSQLAVLLLLTAAVMFVGLFNSEFVSALLRNGYPVGCVLLALVWSAGHAWKWGARGVGHWRAGTAGDTGGLVAEPMESPAESESDAAGATAQTPEDEPPAASEQDGSSGKVSTDDLGAEEKGGSDDE